MSEVGILDASAILACLRREPGQERVATALAKGACWLSAVNLCEVLGKLCEKGMPAGDAQAAVSHMRMTVVDFDADLAALAAFLRVRTKSIGASLGDRACLALAQQAATTDVTPVVYTTDQAWTKLKWPFKVVVIR